jgi:hypothetical protein
MKKALLFLPILLICDDTFLTQYEYGLMLYKNPRGIGCHHCHGIKGEGKIIAKYKHKGKNQELKAPKISDISYDDFINSFKIRDSVMPKYHLTKKELQTIYLYLNYEEKKEKNKQKATKEIKKSKENKENNDS